MTIDQFISFFSSFLNLMQCTQCYNARNVYNGQRVVQRITAYIWGNDPNAPGDIINVNQHASFEFLSLSKFGSNIGHTQKLKYFQQDNHEGDSDVLCVSGQTTFFSQYRTMTLKMYRGTICFCRYVRIQNIIKTIFIFFIYLFYIHSSRHLWPQWQKATTVALLCKDNQS